MKDKKGFAISGVIYSLLLIFLVLILNSLNNLQNKKQVLDQLKLDTVNAIDQPWQVELANLQNQINQLKETTGLDKTYPIGSLYISTKSDEPSKLLGGVWERYGKGRTLVSVDESQTEFSDVDKTGGEKVHTLTMNEMPSHTHIQNAHFHYITAYDVFNPSYVFTANDHGGDYIASTDNAVRELASGEIKSNRYRTDDTVAINQNTGGSQAHNNLQPYITVYMWKRTA